MNWWQILIAVFFTAPWLYLFFIEVVLEPIKHSKTRNKKTVNWNISNPKLQRRKCKSCKYSVSETFWDGLYKYQNQIPRRRTVYCKLTKLKISNFDARCIIPEPPTNYFWEPKNTKEPLPKSDTEIYYSAYGNCYHSNPQCKSIKNSQNIYTNRIYISDRYPCPLCWIEKDGILYPKKSNR